MFDRAEGYLGVMIDDLVTRGVTEPYRMFTSRAEYRLTLRADNADQRLTAKGIAIGCVGRASAAQLGAKMEALEAARALARSLSVTPNEAGRHGLALNKDGQRRTRHRLLSYPNIGIADIIRVWPQLGRDPADRLREQIEIDAKYAVYLDRQAADVAAYRRDEALELPEDLDYAAMTALSMEVRQKLQTIRPRTIGQAGRIDGMTPAALTLLVAHCGAQSRSAAVGQYGKPPASTPMRRATLDSISPPTESGRRCSVTVSRETWERLEHFVDLLLKWQAIDQSDRVLDNSSVVDAARRRFAAARPARAECAPLDRSGSGGGSPGLVIACALAGKPGAEVHLVESVQKKPPSCASRSSDLRSPPLSTRSESRILFRSRPALDVVTARALAPLDR